MSQLKESGTYYYVWSTTENSTLFCVLMSLNYECHYHVGFTCLHVHINIWGSPSLTDHTVDEMQQSTSSQFSGYYNGPPLSQPQPDSSLTYLSMPPPTFPAVRYKVRVLIIAPDTYANHSISVCVVTGHICGYNKLVQEKSKLVYLNSILTRLIMCSNKWG